MIMVSLWMSFSVGFLAMLAGLQTVNRELYEAGRIDGLSNRLQEVFYITIPSMKPQMLFSAVMTIVSTLKAGSISTQLTGMAVTPQYAGHLIINHVDDYAFIRFELGYASAVSVMLLLFSYFVMSLLSGLQNNVAGQNMAAAAGLLIFIPNLIIFLLFQRKPIYRPAGAYSADFGEPVDLYVASDDKVYIADKKQNRVVVLDQDGSLLREFMGYFGANKADQSMLNWLKKLVLNKDQLAKEKAALPKPITNVSLDKDGFIYTSTAGGEGKGAIRKLNAGGVDIFKNKTLVNGHGIVDVAIDGDAFLYNIDLDSMHINLYNRDGEVMFEFGLVSKDTQQYGILGYPTGIGVDSHHAIWISDSGTNTVHKYVRTDLGRDILKALALYAEGKYEQSKPYWEAVYAQTIKNSAVTVFAILTIWMFGFIIFGLSFNLYDFFYELYKEVNFNL
ncbi:hypothetical protein G195_000132 [Phytophthora kernoviae 00238/432]|uniref:ABC transmembrane type-1 domain-containing protein n=1 Tax=Phytophthora kernoviae 00238/432 TaxID=1284355 RepID=A0A8J4WC18_9STRA|nr:hypothetical protein G195_000132 [Phytophthora kernoviae 00238/432]